VHAFDDERCVGCAGRVRRSWQAPRLALSRTDTCRAMCAAGVWSGQPPNLNAQSFCGYFYWTGSYGVAQSRYLSTSWTLACSSGYFLACVTRRRHTRRPPHGVC